MTKKKATTRRGPIRYDNVKGLADAVFAVCAAALESGARLPKERARPVASIVADLVKLRSLAEDDAGRDLCARLAVDLAEAFELVAARRRDTYYRRRLAAVIDAITGPSPGGNYSRRRIRDALPKDADTTSRRALVQQIDTPSPCQLSNRDVAIRSLLSGNGTDWALKQITKARDTGVGVHWPTVRGALEAEQRAIALVRKSVREETAAVQAKARELDRATTPAARQRLATELRALRRR